MAKAAAQTKEPVVDHSIIIKKVADNPILLMTDEKALDSYLAALRADVDANPGDVKTAKGRDQIKSQAAEIGRKKTAIDKERLRKTEEWRTMTATVNAAGKVVKERMQALQDEVRAPLTAWEESEEARQNEVNEILTDMRQAVIIQVGVGSDELRERLDRIRGRNLSDETFGPRIHEAVDLRDEAVAALQAAIERIEQEERDRAELQRLREERELREKEDADRAWQEQEARDKEEADRAAAAAEEQRQKDQAAQIEREREEAAQAAQHEAERLAEERRLEAEREAQRKIDEANAAALAARQDAATGRAMTVIREAALGFVEGENTPWDKIIVHLQALDVSNDTLGRDAITVSRARDTAIERANEKLAAAAEELRKQQDQDYRTSIKTKVKQALMTCGADEETARKIVIAVLAGEIPNVTLTF